MEGKDANISPYFYPLRLYVFPQGQKMKEGGQKQFSCPSAAILSLMNIPPTPQKKKDTKIVFFHDDKKSWTRHCLKLNDDNKKTF